MTTDLTLTPPRALAAGDLDAAFAAFDGAVARFLAKYKPRTAKTYKPGLALYRDVAYAAGVDPLRADALIIFNRTMEAQRRDRGGGKANDTIRIRMKPVARFFSWCWDFNLTPLKPGQTRSLLSMPPARKLSPRDILTADEARRLIAAAGTPEARCLIRVMLDAGLRVSEALGVTCGDVYTEADRYYINVRDAKGDEPRDVEIDADLYHALAAVAGGELTDPKRTYDAIFDTSRFSAWRWVKAAAELAGIDKNVTPHCLRHTCANDLARQGWPHALIAARMGHKSLDTTKIYTRPAEMLKQIPLPTMSWNAEEVDIIKST